jgi:hypothetical protein
VFASVLVVLGAISFASRALLACHISARAGGWWFVIAFAIGGLGAGATIARHGGGWRASVLAAVLALVFLACVGLGAGVEASPIAFMATLQLALACVLVIGATFAGGLLGRRVTSAPSAPAIIVLSGLIMYGAAVAMVFTLAAFGAVDPSDSAVWLVLFAIIVAGFVTQALIAARRPWTCASGGLFLILLVAQEGDAFGIAGVAIAIGFLTLLAWIGARLATHVYWGAPAMPEARAIER